VEASIRQEDQVMAAPKKYPVEVRDRAIRLVQDLVSDEELRLSVTGACTRVGQQLGINRDTLRGWVKQVQIDSGQRPGLSTDERRRLKELEAENRELRRANAILKTASAFFAAELDRPLPRS
jgi:transposase